MHSLIFLLHKGHHKKYKTNKISLIFNSLVQSTCFNRFNGNFFYSQSEVIVARNLQNWTFFQNSWSINFYASGISITWNLSVHKTKRPFDWNPSNNFLFLAEISFLLCNFCLYTVSVSVVQQIPTIVFLLGYLLLLFVLFLLYFTFGQGATEQRTTWVLFTRAPLWYLLLVLLVYSRVGGPVAVVKKRKDKRSWFRKRREIVIAFM